MLRLFLLVGLLGLASTGICAPQNVKYPTLSTSKGFKLVIKIQESSKDFDPPVDNTYITSIHTGAGLAEIGNAPDDGRIFYQNGTEDEFKNGGSTVITDGGTPPFPSGFKLNRDGDSGLSTGRLDAGPGTAGVKLQEKPVSYLLPEYYLACSEALEYYQGKKFIVIRHSDKSDDIPEECRSIRLVPQCAQLNDLPADASASHEYALDSPCYENVASISLESSGST